MKLKRSMFLGVLALLFSMNLVFAGNIIFKDGVLTSDDNVTTLNYFIGDGSKLTNVSTIDTNETTRFNNLVSTDCTTDFFVRGVQNNGTVDCLEADYITSLTVNNLTESVTLLKTKNLLRLIAGSNIASIALASDEESANITINAANESDPNAYNGSLRGINDNNFTGNLDVHGFRADISLRSNGSDVGDLIFWNGSGDQKGRIWTNPFQGVNELHFSSADTISDITIDGNGDVIIAGQANIGTGNFTTIKVDGKDIDFDNPSHGDVLYYNSSSGSWMSPGTPNDGESLTYCNNGGMQWMNVMGGFACPI